MIELAVAALGAAESTDPEVAQLLEVLGEKKRAEDVLRIERLLCLEPPFVP
jgi:hypothetical protein